MFMIYWDMPSFHPLTRFASILLATAFLSKPAYSDLLDCADVDAMPDAKLAREAMYEGNSPRAHELATVLAARCPKSPDALRLLGNVYLLRETPAVLTAVTLYRRAMALDPDDPDIWADLANGLAELGEYAEEAALLERIVRARPDEIHLRRRWATALEKAGDVDGAASVLRGLLDLVEWDAVVWTEIGDLYFSHDRPREAAKAFHKRIALTPDDALAWNQFGNALSNFDHEAAIQAYLRSIKLDGDDGIAWSNLALAYLAAGLDGAALKAARRSVELDDGHFAFWYNLGIVHRDRGEFDEAAKAIRRATELEPEFQKAWNILARIEQGRGNASAAEEQQRAASMQPKTLSQWQNRLDFLRTQGLLGEEAEVRQKIVELRQQLDEGKATARAQIEAGLTTEALATIAGVLPIHPEDPELEDLRRRVYEIRMGTQLRFLHSTPERLEEGKGWRGQGIKAYEQGDHATAEVAFRKAIEVEGDTGFASVTWFYLGLLYGDQERWGESADAYRRSLELKPNDPATWNNLGYTYFYADEHIRARDAYLRAVALNGDYTMAWENLAEVYAMLEDRDGLVHALDQIVRLGGDVPEGVVDPRQQR